MERERERERGEEENGEQMPKCEETATLILEPHQCPVISYCSPHGDTYGVAKSGVEGLSI